MLLPLNRFLTGDCFPILSTFPDESIDFILTDPPYGIAYWSNRSDAHERIKNDSFECWKKLLPNLCKEFKRLLTPTGICAIFSSGGGKNPATAILTLELINHLNLIQTLVWDKQTIGLGWRYRPSYEHILIVSKDKDNYNFYDESKKCSNIIRYPNHIPNRDDHPTQKPVGLMKKLINIHSKIGDIVLDPFVGQGTTCIAAEELHRKWIGIDIDSVYIELAQGKMHKINRGVF